MFDVQAVGGVAGGRLVLVCGACGTQRCGCWHGLRRRGLSLPGVAAGPAGAGAGVGGLDAAGWRAAAAGWAAPGGGGCVRAGAGARRAGSVSSAAGCVPGAGARLVRAGSAVLPAWAPRSVSGAPAVDACSRGRGQLLLSVFLPDRLRFRWRPVSRWWWRRAAGPRWFAAEFVGQPVGLGACPGQLVRVGERGADRGAAAFVLTWIALVSSATLSRSAARSASLFSSRVISPTGGLSDVRPSRFPRSAGRSGHAVEPQVRPYLIAEPQVGAEMMVNPPSEPMIPSSSRGRVPPGLGDLGVQHAAQAGRRRRFAC